MYVYSIAVGLSGGYKNIISHLQDRVQLIQGRSFPEVSSLICALAFRALQSFQVSCPPLSHACPSVGQEHVTFTRSADHIIMTWIDVKIGGGGGEFML